MRCNVLRGADGSAWNIEVGGFFGEEKRSRRFFKAAFLLLFRKPAQELGGYHRRISPMSARYCEAGPRRTMGPPRSVGVGTGREAISMVKVLSFTVRCAYPSVV